MGEGCKTPSLLVAPCPFCCAVPAFCRRGQGACLPRLGGAFLYTSAFSLSFRQNKTVAAKRRRFFYFFTPWRRGILKKIARPFLFAASAPQPTNHPKERFMQRKSRLSLYEYREWLLYFAVFLAVFTADRAIPGAPLGLSLYFAFATCGFSLFALAAICLVSAATLGSFAFLCAYFCALCLMTVIFSVYRAKNARMGADRKSVV